MSEFRYGSVCSGIEAATAAWHPLGWEPAFFSEIEPFPRAVLSHHYPDVPLHGDFTTIEGNEYGPINLLVGGTPCQSFSIAGLRGGLDDDRGNLALEFLRLADRTRPRWLVWENVPGVLSSNGGRDFGSILGGLVELGYGFAYRVLDAQYFGVAQRRRRVFVVGCLGDAGSAAAVLFERHSLQGNSSPRREKGEEIAGTIAARFGISRNNHEELTLAKTLIARNGCGGFDLDSETAVVQDVDQGHSLPIIPFDLAQITSKTNRSKAEDGMPAPTMSKNSNMHVATSAVRRLTPIECERLQGFPDNFTRIRWRNKSEDDCPDGPRYKALGNSMAVPVMRWIGERIKKVEEL